MIANVKIVAAADLNGNPGIQRKVKEKTDISYFVQGLVFFVVDFSLPAFIGMQSKVLTIRGLGSSCDSFMVDTPTIWRS